MARYMPYCTTAFVEYKAFGLGVGYRSRRFVYWHRVPIRRTEPQIALTKKGWQCSIANIRSADWITSSLIFGIFVSFNLHPQNL